MSSLPCILIPAIVGVLCGILGYLIGRMAWNGTEGGRASTLKAELEACRSNTKHLNSKIEKLEGELSASKENSAKSVSSPKVASTSKTSNAAKPKAKTAVSTEGFDAAAAKAAIGKKVTYNDLKAIEGVGPKIAEIFNAAGVKTWKGMAETTAAKAKSILKEAGDRYTIHNPGTWARQAKMMHEGKWVELKAWQDTLDGGKE